MMRRSSGELSSGMSGCGVRPSLGDLRGVVSAYLRRALLRHPPRVLSSSYSSPCCIQPVSSVRIMHMWCRRTSELLDCEIPVLLALVGG